MGEEISIKLELPDVPDEPEVIELPVASGLSEVEMAELVSLREFKMISDEARLLEVERLAEEAARIADLALEISIETEIEEVQETEVMPLPVEVIEQEPDTAPNNDHPFFKTW